MKAEQRVREERVQRCPAAKPVVGELCMGPVARDTKLFPLRYVALGDVTVLLGVAGSIQQVCELTESFDANDTLKS